MIALLVPFGLSLGLCLALTPLARNVAARLGLTDKPDGHRKVHARPTPLAGGIAILFASSLALASVFFVPNPWRDTLDQNGTQLIGLFIASVVICGVGLLDDWFGLRAWAKLFGQMTAIALLIHCGLVVQNIRVFDLDLELGMLSVPFTVVWLLGTMNSLNLLDGMDGLLSCLGLIITGTMAVMAAMMGQWAAACVAATLAGALLGFLRYNFPPASVFLGDAGSMLIGLIVGVLAIHSSLKGPATIGLALPVALLTLPFMDTTAAIVRRKLRGLSFCMPDRGHLHHCLLRHGLSNRWVLGCVSLLCLATGLGALASLAFNSELFAILAALAVVGILVASRMFGYVELMLLKERLMTRMETLWRATVNGKSGAPGFAGDADGAWKELWDTLTARAVHFNLQVIRLDVRGGTEPGGCHALWANPNDQGAEAGLWRAEIPVKVGGEDVGRLEAVGRRDRDPFWRKMAALAKLVEDFEKRELAIDEPVTLSHGF
jgi:UDP-GlcNAc:undecaprenyl-phosphate GlcNAc-1-phosphate transferase